MHLKASVLEQLTHFRKGVLNDRTLSRILANYYRRYGGNNGRGIYCVRSYLWGCRTVH